MARAKISKNGLKVTLPFPIGTMIWYPDVHQVGTKWWGITPDGHEYSWKLIGSRQEVFTSREVAMEYLNSAAFKNSLQYKNQY